MSTIREFKIIQHFVNEDFDVECGLYYIKSINNKYYIVQTKDDYKAIMHFTDRTELVNIRPDIIEEIKDLLEKEGKEDE